MRRTVAALAAFTALALPGVVGATEGIVRPAHRVEAQISRPDGASYTIVVDGAEPDAPIRTVSISCGSVTTTADISKIDGAILGVSVETESSDCETGLRIFVYTAPRIPPPWDRPIETWDVYLLDGKLAAIAPPLARMRMPEQASPEQK